MSTQKSNDREKRNKKNVSITILFELVIFGVLIIIGSSVVAYAQENGEGTLGYFHNLGDAVGGMTAPVIGLVSALLVYRSFQEQIIANEIVLDGRDEDKKKERLENEVKRQIQIAEKAREILERIENKFRFISERFGGESRLHAIIIFTVEKFGGITTDTIERLRTGITYQNINVEMEGHQLVGELEGLLVNCNFFCSYILQVNRDTNLTLTTRDFLSLSIEEFIIFFDNKLQGFSTIRRLAFAEDVKGFELSMSQFLRRYIFVSERIGDLHEVNVTSMNPETRTLLTQG